MAQDFALITFEYDGHSFEILNDADAAREVANGRILAGTRLTVYAIDGGISVQNAEDVPSIAAHFSARTPIARAPEFKPEPQPAKAPEPAVPSPTHDYTLKHNFSDGHDGPAYLVRWSVEPDVPFEAGDVLCIVQTEHAIIRIPAPGAGRLVKKLARTHTPVTLGTPLAKLALDWRPGKELAPDIRYFAAPQDPPASTPPSIEDAFYTPPPRRTGMGCGMWMVLLIGLLAIAVLAKNRSNDANEDSARDAAVVVDNAALGSPDFRPPGDTVDRFVIRRATLFRQPNERANEGAKTVEQLERGGSVTGIYFRNADGDDWLWLANGAGAGQFLRASDLSQREPPPLSNQNERPMKLIANAPVFVWPDTAATVQVDRDGADIALPAGDLVTVTGTTENAFYEILLTEKQGGGVGYIARATIDGGAVFLPTDDLLDRGIASARGVLKMGVQLALPKPSAPALKVTNRCPMAATIFFYYRSAEGWTHHKGSSWDYDAGDSGYPTLPAGDRLHPVDGDILYAAAPKGRGPLRQGRYDRAIVINGQEYHFRRAQTERMSNGDYVFELTC